MNPKPHTEPVTSAEFFDRLYRKAGDPWNFRHSTYEQQRYDTIVHWLADRRYTAAFEPGCAIGELTAKLAPLCDHLEAMDFSPAAVKQAQERCRQWPHVQIHAGALPDDLPPRHWELIVLSEIGYYFTPDTLTSLLERLQSQLLPGGRLIACHWLGHSDDHRLHGSEVHRILEETLGHPERQNDDKDGYTLGLWSSADL